MKDPEVLLLATIGTTVGALIYGFDWIAYVATIAFVFLTMRENK